MKLNNSPLHWIIWHPHQRLWNLSLLKIVRKIAFNKWLASLIIKAIVRVDTLILGMGLFFFPRNINKKGYSAEKNINYFDLGTYKSAQELTWIHAQVFNKLPNPINIYAFEANPESFQEVKGKVKHIENIHLFNVALVNEKADTGFVRLYTSEKGLGDSIYRENNGSFVDVRAARLSEIIGSNNIELENSINILRMNIEGAEYDVLKDLHEQGFLENFSGFYGMWDDLSKIDFEKDKKFRDFLQKIDIKPLTFNGRDMLHRSRLKLIENSVNLAIKGQS